MNKYTISLIIILALGFGLRTEALTKVPASLYWDEAAIAYDAYSLSQTGRDMHGSQWYQVIFPSYGDYKLPMMIWLSAISMKLLGPTALGLRLVSVIAGTLLILWVYLLGHEAFKSRSVGLFSAALVAFSPWAIQFSRAGFEANTALMFLTLFCLLLFKALKHSYLFALCGIVGALSVYSYFSVRFVIPVILICFVLLFFQKLSRRSWLWLAAGGIIYLAAQAPIYWSPNFEASNQFRLSTPSLLNTDNHIVEQNINRELISNSPLSRLIYHRYWFFLKRLSANIANHLDWRYLFFAGDVNLRHGTGQIGLFLTPWLVFLLAGLAVGLKQNFKMTLFFLAWWLAALVPASVPLTTPHALRSLNALPPIALIMGYGAYQIWQSKRLGIKLLFTGLIIWSVISFSYYWHDYWQHYPERSAEAWQYGYEQLAAFLGQTKYFGREVYLDPQDRFYLYLLFFNRLDPALIQGKTEKFKITDFERYHLGTVTEEKIDQAKSGDLWVTKAHENTATQSGSLVGTINDLGGKPLYRIYEKI